MRKTSYTIEELNAMLRPCPFCGRPATILSSEMTTARIGITICCTGCGASVQHWHDHPDLFSTSPWGRLTAVQFWNGEALKKEAER